MRGGLARPLHFLAHRGWKFLLPSDVLQADTILVQRRDFLLQIAAQKSHEKIHFALGTLLPVFFRERIQRKRRDSNPGSGLDGGAHGCYTSAMSGHARQMTAARPASVPVHDDGDVFWEPFWIEPQVNFRFFAIQPGRNCCLQS